MNRRVNLDLVGAVFNRFDEKIGILVRTLTPKENVQHAAIDICKIVVDPGSVQAGHVVQILLCIRPYKCNGYKADRYVQQQNWKQQQND